MSHDQVLKEKNNTNTVAFRIRTGPSRVMSTPSPGLLAVLVLLGGGPSKARSRDTISPAAFDDTANGGAGGIRTHVWGMPTN